jgi:transketolase
MANAIRALAMDAVEAANSGHPGMPMGMADVATVLFCRHLKFDASAPDWPDRDRFVLSAGHGSMLLYAVLYLTGYADMTLDEIRRFRQLGARTAGHPEYGAASGIEMTTGPLGQGLGAAVGMALAERMQNARFGDGLVDHHTYVMAGDGCLMEGLSHEAIDLAGHLKLSRLIVLFDDNGISIDGPTSLATSMDQLERFQAAGWRAVAIDGHDRRAIDEAIAAARASDKPSLIACRTVIGYGAPDKQGTAAAHGAALGADQVARAREALGWPHEPFEIPPDILDAWRRAGGLGRADRQVWQSRLVDKEAESRLLFEDGVSGALPDEFDEIVETIKKDFSSSAPALATRQSSAQTLAVLTHASPSLIGGSADLTVSNGTRTKDAVPITPGDYGGDYIHYGVREHGMAAAMNGIALHGGFIPYGGTFLVFADYSRPAIRMAALMGLRVIHVMTHDSIGLGEDGPTHQPVEHLAALRAIPNLLLFRPADAVETVEAWACALEHARTPSVLCLTRQSLPTLRTQHTDNNLVGFGAYVLHEPVGGRDVTLLATGSEVAIAMDAVSLLAAEGIGAAVVSMPCWELFKRQPRDYRREVLGHGPRMGIEAAVRDGWEQWIGSDGVFIGMAGFGASAPAPALYEKFDITPEWVAGAAGSLIL